MQLCMDKSRERRDIINFNSTYIHPAFQLYSYINSEGFYRGLFVVREVVA